VEPTLVVIGLSHHTAPIEVRERFWISGRRQAEALSRLSQGEGIDEIFVFSTCHRTEFVVWGDATLAINSVLRFLTAEYDLKLCDWNRFYRLLDEQAMTHAFRVSCGLDSGRIAEEQIARQVNAAWQQARNAGSTGRFLDAVLRKALEVRRRVREETALGSYFASPSQRAVSLAEQVFGSLAERNVVVVGTGRMGEASLQILARLGARSICVISHTEADAHDLARRTGAKACAFEDRGTPLATADLVISATAAPGFVITAHDLNQVSPQRQGRKLVLIDLALPRDIDPGVREIEGVLLYNLEDLARAVEPPADVRDDELKAEAIVSQEVQEFEKELKTEGVAPAILALRQRLDEICRQELESFRLEQGPFPKDQDRLVAAVSARITHRIAGSLARGRDFRL